MHTTTHKYAAMSVNTHEKPKFEKFKCMCVKQFPQLLETLSFKILRSPINLHCF